VRDNVTGACMAQDSIDAHGWDGMCIKGSVVAISLIGLRCACLP